MLEKTGFSYKKIFSSQKTCGKPLKPWLFHGPLLLLFKLKTPIVRAMPSLK